MGPSRGDKRGRSLSVALIGKMEDRGWKRLGRWVAGARTAFPISSMPGSDKTITGFNGFPAPEGRSGISIHLQSSIFYPPPDKSSSSNTAIYGKLRYSSS